jgi:hypothetical protein
MKNKTELTYVGADRFNRPCFTDNIGNYYGSTEILVDDDKLEDVLKVVKLEDLTYFGTSFGCEPMGTPIDYDKFILLHEG